GRAPARAARGLLALGPSSRTSLTEPDRSDRRGCFRRRGVGTGLRLRLAFSHAPCPVRRSGWEENKRLIGVDLGLANQILPLYLPCNPCANCSTYPRLARRIDAICYMTAN